MDAQKLGKVFPACFLPYRIAIQVFDSHASCAAMKQRTFWGMATPFRRSSPRVSEGAELEREAQPVVCPAAQPDLLDAVVGQRVIARQRGFVRGKSNSAARWRTLQMFSLGMFRLYVVRWFRAGPRCP